MVSRQHIQRDIDQLKKVLLDIATIVEDSIEKSIFAFLERDADTAKIVIQQDEEIDLKEVGLEEECLKVLALHQPVAGDLRYIVTILKVNNDLERMGDLAANIAEYVIALAKLPPLKVAYDFNQQANKVQDIVKKSLDALTNTDCALAKLVLAMDDAIDKSHRDAFQIIQTAMQKNKNNINVGVYLLSFAKQLERIADLATNIAEDTLYMVDGEVIRHKTLVS